MTDQEMEPSADKEALRARVELLREALGEAVKLYSEYGLVANHADCGKWINNARETLEATK